MPNQYVIIAKQIAIVSVIISLNTLIQYYILPNTYHYLLQHVYCVLLLIVFLDGTVIYNDLKLLQSRFDDLMQCYTIVHEAYTEERKLMYLIEILQKQTQSNELIKNKVKKKKKNKNIVQIAKNLWDLHLKSQEKKGIRRRH